MFSLLWCNFFGSFLRESAIMRMYMNKWADAWEKILKKMQGMGEARLIFHQSCLLTISCAQLFLDSFAWSFRKISGLNVFLDSYERLLKSVKRAWVQHLLLNFGCVGAPRHQEKLLFLGAVGCALALMHVFKIEESVSAFAGTKMSKF